MSGKSFIHGWSELDAGQLEGDKTRRILVDDEGYLLIRAKGNDWEHTNQLLTSLIEKIDTLISATWEITS